MNKAVKMGINDDRVINYVRKYADPKYKKMSNTDIAEEILVEHDHDPTFSNMIPDILRALGRW